MYLCPIFLFSFTMGMQSVRLLLIYYVFLSEVAFTVFSLGDLFYPFGTSSGDITNPIRDDGSSPNISISTWFPFFERSYKSLYVNNNGVISFVVPVSQYTSTAFPLPDGRAFIAPFWADVDNSLRGNVYYRQSTEEALLQRATADVRKYSTGLQFQARWVFVATWDNVAYYGSQSTKVNSFQAVLITDGLQSFIIFNYGNIEWTTGTASGGYPSTGLGGTPAQAGFNSGDSLNFFSIPGSRTSEIIDIEKTSNVDEPGRWVFRADAFKALGGCIYKGRYIRENQTVWVNGSCQTKCKCSSEGSLTCVSEPCGAAEICVPAPPFHACRPVSMKTCNVYGDPHYYTFDQRVIHFQGTCTYVLSELCDRLSSLTYYRVEGENENRGSVAVSFVRLVRLLVYGTEVIMLKGTTNYVLVNGTRSSVPVFLEDGRLQVLTAGFTMRATADFGLTVTYDGSHRASITLPGSYHGAVCGMCGNMNGDPSDDLRTRSGNLTTSPGIFGASWRADGGSGGDGCRDSCSDRCGVCTEAERYSLPSSCGLLRAQDGPFRHCHAAIDPRDFEQSCAYDLCATGGLEASLCQALSSYAEACRSAGMRPEPWRTETLCGIRCPTNSHYEACGNVCDRDCVFNSSTLHCNESCSEGCFCDPGYFRDGSECVPRDRCGCLHHGVYMKLGERKVSPECAEVCQCSQGRRVHCVPLGCGAGEICTIRGGRRGCFTAQALCTVTGGGAHLLSFDGRPARLRGHCTHTLAEVCCNASAPWFRVTAEKWQEGEMAEGVTRVRVQLVGADFVLERGRPPTMNGTLISLPFTIPSVASLSNVGGDAIAVTASQLEVRFDGEGTIFVRVGPSYAGFLRGMCGNWNDDPSDDDLEPSRNGSEPRCEDNSNVTEPRCPQSPSFESQCSIILDIAGPFAACHRRLDPENYYRSCVYDLCLHGSNGTRLCRTITSYEKGCILEGVHVPAWRNPRICPMPNPCRDQECTAEEWCGERGGNYGCFCNTTTNLANHRAYDYQLTCCGDNSSISFARCLLFSDGWAAQSFHLNDPNCKANLSHGRAIFTFNSHQRSCGSKLKVNRTHFIHSNTVHGYYGADNGIVLRNRTLSIEFSCTVPLTINLSLPLGKVVMSVVNIVLPTGTGCLEASMIMYRDAQYSQAYTETPIFLEVGSMVYIGIHVRDLDADQFVATLENCWVTPISDPSSHVKWALVTNQCPNAVSEVVIEESGVSSISRFKFSAFKFQGDVNDVYVHCQIQLCNFRTTRCSLNCPHQRAARNVRGMKQTGIFTIGPVRKLSNTDFMVDGNDVILSSP
ncbi:alpha-tectorin-like [Hemitrygon akajei]|uniref:alpha-tectorin-like n=1 Tax=Hemitrygon akajei TaxID=2704970 RepID=UPI003BF9D1DD